MEINRTMFDKFTLVQCTDGTGKTMFKGYVITRYTNGLCRTIINGDVIETNSPLEMMKYLESLAPRK